MGEKEKIWRWFHLCGFLSGLGLGFLMVAGVCWSLQTTYMEEIKAVVRGLGGHVEFGMEWVIADMVFIVIGVALFIIGLMGYALLYSKHIRVHHQNY